MDINQRVTEINEVDAAIKGIITTLERLDVIINNTTGSVSIVVRRSNSYGFTTVHDDTEHIALDFARDQRIRLEERLKALTERMRTMLGASEEAKTEQEYDVNVTYTMAGTIKVMATSANEAEGKAADRFEAELEEAVEGQKIIASDVTMNTAEYLKDKK